MIRAVLFDLDNTLTDFMKMKDGAIVAAVAAMIWSGLEATMSCQRLISPDAMRVVSRKPVPVALSSSVVQMLTRAAATRCGK